jgi:nucleoside-diphosphate-sugar epimerase
MVSRTVLVTGANGFIGSAVANKFSHQGWTTYGLVRRDTSALELMRNEIVPIVGTATDASTFVPTLPPIDVIITCDEDIPNYVSHHEHRLAMIKEICKHSKYQGSTSKPLVIFTSGCKDYGMTSMHGDPNLAPHTETSPMNPPELLRPRTNAALDMLTNHADDFDCVVTRPTTLYGRSGSYYSYFFSLCERAKEESDGVLELPADANAILHGTHIDDVAAAYLAIATAPHERVAGQSYNISGHRYETLAEILPVMEKSHGIKVVLRDARPEDMETFGLYVMALSSFPQWVGSDKIRADLGWVDVKPLFHEGYDLYRKAYEAAKMDESEHVRRVMGKKARGTLQGGQT